MRMKIMTACLILSLALLIALSLALAEQALGTPQEEIDNFTDAFVTVPENPLPGDLSWLLWNIAQETPEEDVAAEPPPLAQAAAKFEALVQEKGVYYEDFASFMGMDMKSEYWFKGNKIKKYDHLMDEVVLLDGEWFYKYSPGGKTGTRLSPEAPEALAAITMIRSSLITATAVAPYEQLDDAKEGGYDCQVFYMDIEMMGMKGNWLYVDKATGVVVKNQFGEGEQGISTVLTKLETGTFGDEAFEIPAKVKISGP